MTRMSKSRRMLPACLTVLALFVAPAVGAQAVRFGPVDGASLPAQDTGRVAVGMAAPDFVLESKDGAAVRLSQFRAKKNVVLVFYRGHW
jgi:cytochrome oxidase Cu insertion factor (SCO1/SenC/PrrC family)